jgi:mannose-6-phosphate isomerase-like protein (cupin superfamily)
MHPTFDFRTTYVHLEDGPVAAPLEVTEDFWTRIDSRSVLSEGRLVAAFHFTEDWDSWEMHPAGDEIVYLLSGAIDLVLDHGNGARIVELRNRAASIIPRGAWHRAIVKQPSDALFITRGAGTTHRPV